MLEGTFAVIFICKDSNKLIAARKSSPLILGIGDGEFFLASDFNGFINHTKKALFLEDNDLIIVDNNYKVFNLNDNKIVNRNVTKIETSYESYNFDKDFMFQEILEQPLVLKNMIKNILIDEKVVLDLDSEYFKKVKRIVICACGSSYYAGLIGKFFIENLSKIPVEVDYASEFRYRDPLIDNNTLVITISQSGETADTLGALREAKIRGAKIISICNVFGSSISRESDFVLYTNAGPEIGVASTKSFTSQLGIIYLFSIYLAQIFKNIDEETIIDKIKNFKKIPDKIEIILKNNKIKKIADLYYNKTNALYLGKGINYPVALEGALKLKEISYIYAEGYPASELKHGHIALIDDKMPVFFIAVGNNYSKIKNNIQEVKSRKGIIISLLNYHDKDVINLSKEVIFIPETSDLLYPFLTVIPFQLLAYYIGKNKGHDVNKPRALAKSVTVE
jgi:glucosamine--fructose-6-phosphate aminotransferase (isomerizing)